jgi:hypothetical protein
MIHGRGLRGGDRIHFSWSIELLAFSISLNI